MLAGGRRLSRIGRVVLALTALAGMAAAVGFLYWTEVEHRFLPITAGQVYRSGEMPPAVLQEKVRQYGIRSVIDLRRASEGVDAERAALEDVGVSHYHLHSSQVPSPAVLASYLELLDTAERPLLVHCEHGIGRAVLFSAIYRMEYEAWENERARSTAYWRSGLGSDFRPDESKGRFILDYLPSRGVRPMTRPAIIGRR